MSTEIQHRAASQYNLPLFGYVLTCVMLLTACRTVMGDAMAVVHAVTQHDLQLHSMEPITRTSPLYWLHGDGAWASKWDCTGHDLWLAVTVILANLWMSWECWRYSRSCGAAFYQLQDSMARTHVLQLRRVFIQCMFVHFGTGVLAWWLPAYWALAGLVIMSAWQTRRLNTTKIQILHAQELANTAASAAAVLATIDNQQLAVHDRLDQARDLLMQRVPYASS